jgi:striatin 1/3/4
MAYNGRPRKHMPETGKDFPILNGISLMSGPSSTSSASGGQMNSLDRANSMNSTMQQGQSNQLGQQQPTLQTQHLDRDKDIESEPRQLTAIFRPDDAGEWKEKLRQAHDASEQARLGVSWDRRSRYDDDDGKEEEGEVEDEDTGVVGEGQGTKAWKPKRTLRKSVWFSFHNVHSFDGLHVILAIWMLYELSLSTRTNYVWQQVEMTAPSRSGEWM